MSTFLIEGGCHFGAVRYVQRGPAISVQHCHCARCRKLFGQLSATGAVIDRNDIEIRGAANLVSYRTSPSFDYRFCKTRGCHLFAYEDSEPRLMYFQPATLDGGVHPRHPSGRESHIYVESKAEWETIYGNLPQYDTSSPDEIITGIQRQQQA